MKRGADDAAGDAPPSPALDWVRPSGAVDLVKAAVHERLLRRRQRRLAAVAGGAVLLTLAALFWPGRSSSGGAAGLPASAVVLSPARQELPDGSIAELNGAAGIVVEYTDAVRRVTLRHGEAFFQVAKNPARPFVVVASGVEVRAVGTAFSVNAQAASVEVLVAEGRIAVEHGVRGPPGPAAATAPAEPAPTEFTVLVDAGSRAVVPLADGVRPSAAPQVETVNAAAVGAQLGWRTPRVEFSRTPLGDVARVFRRHAGVRIRFSEPAMAELELSGVLRADNVDSLLRVLEAEFRIRAERRGAEILLLR